MRAVASGLIGRFGTLDPTDGGDSSRFSLSGRWSASDAGGVTRASAYVIRSQLEPVQQLHLFPQRSRRRRPVPPARPAHRHRRRDRPHLPGRPVRSPDGERDRRAGPLSTTSGSGCSTPPPRARSAPCATTASQEGSAALYFDNRVRWTDWLRTSVGVRADGYDARVAADNPLNSGRARDGIVSPKLGLVLGPWADTELFVNYGEGFHSNDVRGVTITVDPGNPLFPLDRVPLLVRSVGSEVGVRTRAIEGLDLDARRCSSSTSIPRTCSWAMPAPPSRAARAGAIGIEWTNRYAADALALARRRSHAHQRALLRPGPGRQPHPRGADRDRGRRLHLRRGARLVRLAAPALFRAAPADRGQFGPLAGARPLVNAPGRLQLRERHQRLPRRAQPVRTRRSARSTTSTNRACPASRPRASPTATSIRSSRWPSA